MPGSAFLIGLVMVPFLSNIAAFLVLCAGADDLDGRRVGGARLLLLIGVLEAVLTLPGAFHPAVIAHLNMVFGSAMQALGCACAVTALAWGLGRRVTLEQLTGSTQGAWRTGYYQWLRGVVPALWR